MIHDDTPERELDRFRASTTKWLFGSFAGWLTLLLCGVGVGFVLLGLRWLRNTSSAYHLTDQRLIVRQGLFNKSIDEIELYRIKDVRVRFSLINQLTGIGTITITSSDRTGDGVLVLRDVPLAPERREAIRRLVDKARRLRGVRELDVDRDVVA
ncbi:PH domain-containing protein [Sphingomonas aracearum]|uniref:PH domain-containing protein n=1 Tax=Sphingomonas aracearum TaxID=2283317 RepID=A0A369VSP3_9SPHN|nr:PH domain-containing protein [Sphingomonas aracearum]RDE04557.1 PH domain-containing protein [Sphingomonas aracearum]